MKRKNTLYPLNQFETTRQKSKQNASQTERKETSKLVVSKTASVGGKQNAKRTISTENPKFETEIRETIEDQRKQLSQADLDVSGLEELKNTVETNSTDISQLKDSVEANSTNIQLLQSTVEANSTDIGLLQSSVETNSTNISQLKSAVGENSTNISQLQSAVEANTTNLGNLETRLDKNESDISLLQETVSGIETEQSHLADNVSNLENDFHQTQASVEQLNSQVSDAQTSITSLQNSFSDAQNSISSLQTKSEDFEKQFSNVSGEISSLKNTDTTHNSKISTAEEKIVALEESLNTLLNTTIPTMQEQIGQGGGGSSTPNWVCFYDFDNIEATNFELDYPILKVEKVNQFMADIFDDLQKYKYLKIETHIQANYFDHYIDISKARKYRNEVTQSYYSAFYYITDVAAQANQFINTIIGLEYNLDRDKVILVIRDIYRLNIRPNTSPQVIDSGTDQTYGITKIYAMPR